MEIDLINYGVLGMWTMYLIYEKQVLYKPLKELLIEIKVLLKKNNGVDKHE